MLFDERIFNLINLPIQWEEKSNGPIYCGQLLFGSRPYGF